MLLASLLLMVVPQSTWYVDDDGVAPGSGTQGAPYTSIAYALAQPLTQSGDTVEVAAGTYPDEVIDFLGKEVHLIGVDGPTQTIVLGAAPVPGFDCSIIRCTSGEGPSTVIEGLTLQDGFGTFVVLSPQAERAGGAIFLDGASPLLRNCHFEGNAAFYGAAVFARNSQVEVDGCEFHNTRALAGPTGNNTGWALYSLGGSIVLRDSLVDGEAPASDVNAIYCELGSLLIERCNLRDNWKGSGFCCNGGGALQSINATVFVVDSTVSNNRAGNLRGGAVWQDGGVLYLTGCIIESNAVLDSYGGALALLNGSSRIESSEFNFNSSVGNGAAGAIYCHLHDLSCVDVRFVGNQAYHGGAVQCGSGSLRMWQCTFDGNVASSFGSSRGGALDIGGTAMIQRSLFANNVASGLPNGEGGAISGSGQFTTVDSCTFVGNRSYGFGSTQDGAVRNVHCANSLFWNNGLNAIGGGSVLTYCLHDSPFPGIGNISADPRFWGPTDFHLRPGSPAIDAGDPASPLDPDGSRADMGAHGFDPWYCGPGCNGNVGVSVCASFANSTGQVGTLTGLGSDRVASNLLVLNGTRLPLNTVGYMLAAQSPGFVPLFGGSNGVLCLGGPILRFSNTVLQSGPGALMSTQLNLTAFPQGQVVTPGDSWYFQLWYRDSVGGITGSNTTQALRVEFI